MSVFDTYNKGSFRGVPFLYQDSDGELGRRQAVFEYPGRDIPFIEDMGRKARTWSMELVVAGSKYMEQRNALIDALSASGPGLLVHPTLGDLTVAVLSARGPVESTREGGTARFSVTFIESGEQQYPAYARDARADVSDTADAVDATAAEELADAVNVEDGGFVLDDLVDQVTGFVGAVLAVVKKISDIVSNSGILAAITAISGAVSALIRAPMDLYMAVKGAWDALVAAVKAPLEAFRALRAFFDFGADDDPVPQTTSARRTQAANRTAMNYAIRVSATVAAARAASLAEYDSQADATAVRDILTAQIDALLLTADGALFSAMMDMRAAIVRDLSTRPGLPGIMTVTLAEDTPALVLAHRLYDDAARSDEIVSRNGLSNPCFIPGGLGLEVLDV